jgi:N-acetylglucosaminyldiphosphoundecaprenol N-acetyl-beta-D-mannosaminyltransferase
VSFPIVAHWNPADRGGREAVRFPDTGGTPPTMTMARDPLRRRQLFGLDFVDARTVHDVIPALLARVDDLADPGWSPHESRLPIVVTPNVDHVVKLFRTRDGVAHDVARRADIVLPDGQPIVWGSRLLKSPLSGRLAGSNLVAAITPMLAADDRRVVVLAHSATLADRIEREGAGFRAVTAPMIDLADQSSLDSVVDSVLDVATEHRAEFLFITLGHPKQEHIAAAILDRWPAEQAPPLVLAVGQSFDMYFGMVRRAPEWVQRCGLEWFFRFVQEPRRLFRRYFIDDPAFVMIAMQEWRAQRTASAARLRAS